MSEWISQLPFLIAPYGLLLGALTAWVFAPGLRRFEWFWMLVGVAGSALISGYRLADSWMYMHDFNGALTAVAARNHLRLGFSYTLGMEMWNGGAALPVQPFFHLHHPPLITWVVLPGYALFGSHEWVTRLSILLPFYLALAWLGHRLCTRAREGCAPLFWAAFAAVPGLVFYARMPRHEPLTLLLLFAVIAIFLDPRERHRPSPWYAPLAALLVLSGWGGVFFAGTACLALAAGRQWRTLLPIATGAGIGGLALVTLLGIRLHGDFTPLLDQFIRRSVATEAESGSIESTGQWFMGVSHHYAELVGWLPTALALIGAFQLSDRKIRDVIAWLLVSAFGLLLVLRQWAYVHEYAILYVAFPVFLLAPHGGHALLAMQRRRVAYLSLLIALAAGSAWSFDAVRARFQKSNDSRFLYGLAQQVRRQTQPTDVMLLAELPPSPIFGFYADRDFIVWPHALVGQGLRPAVFVQFRHLPADAELRRILGEYEPAADAPRIRVLKSRAPE